jgi:hypothetical protein
VIIFGDECIFNKSIEEWPIVDALISFYSSKFPTEKAIAYIKLRKPFNFNDLEMEVVLKDRRKVYEMLKSLHIDVPFHIYLNREDPTVENVIEEFDEYVVINGVQINKPLVEKPVDAEDHNIYIYYPMSAGGGSKRLFRKVKDRSSEFYPHINELRTEGSYIYEEFVHTQGTDVKVYTVGPDYGHAEARKSPVVDGKVNRDSSGYEVRYPVILTPAEKDMARKIVEAFRQTVCGFDILRVQGKSYVCDVNGFSFVKNSRKYYDDATQILMEIMLTALRPEYQATLSTRAPLLLQRERANTNMQRRPSLSAIESSNDSSMTNEDYLNRSPSPSTGLAQHESGNYISTEGLGMSTKTRSKDSLDQEELRCIIAVIRHGDRTPKQKMKVKVALSPYLEYYHSYTKSPYKDLKVKSKSALVKFLDITRNIITAGTLAKDDSLLRKLRQIKDVLERWEISGINRKLQMKPQKWSIDPIIAEENSSFNEATELLVILKWGGDLTPLGRTQAEQVGALFRHNLYPDTEGGGVLRLHSTYRHDLKIKASDEGRVMKTAAAFTKGLLELEGQLTPILASLVTVEEKNRQMLDRGGNNEVRDDMDHCKYHLNMLQVDQEMNQELIQLIAPDASPAIRQALMNLKNPLKTLQRIYELIESICRQVDELCRDFSDSESPSPAPLDFEMNYFSTSAVQSSPSRDQIQQSSATVVTVTGDPTSPPREKIMGTPPIPVAAMNLLDEEQNKSIHEAAELLSSSWPSNQNQSEKAKDAEQPQSTTPKPQVDMMQSIPRTTSFSRGGDSNSVHGSTSRPSELELKSVDDGLYLNETFTLMHDRWSKLYKDFYSEATKMFDLTKVPDVYDMIRYDCLHNHHLRLDGMEELFQLTQYFENAVVPQEYGVDHDEKRLIGSKMCGALLEKIKWDLQVVNSDQRHEMAYSLDHSHAADLAINSLGRLVRTRLYFTSESHLHTLLNVLRYPAAGARCAYSSSGLRALDNISELSYLTQVVIRLFEDRIDPSKFRCEIMLSPGAISNPLEDKNGEIAPYVLLNKSISYDDLMECLTTAIDAGKMHYDEMDPSVYEREVNKLTETVDKPNTETCDADGNAHDLVDSTATTTPPSIDDRAAAERKFSEKKLDLLHAISTTPNASIKRNSSVTVVSNSNLENYDRWETLGGSLNRSKGAEKRKHHPIATKRSNSYVVREINATTTISKPNGPLKLPLRSQSPAPPLPISSNMLPTSTIAATMGIAERELPEPR